MPVMPIAAEGPVAQYNPELRPWVVSVGYCPEDIVTYVVMARSANEALERLAQTQNIGYYDQASEPRLLAFDSELIAAV